MDDLPISFYVKIKLTDTAANQGKAPFLYGFRFRFYVNEELAISMDQYGEPLDFPPGTRELIIPAGPKWDGKNQNGQVYPSGVYNWKIIVDVYRKNPECKSQGLGDCGEKTIGAATAEGEVIIDVTGPEIELIQPIDNTIATEPLPLIKIG